MAKWNMFSPEVREERRKIRDYGIDNVNNRLPVQDSYKAQALRELAMRLELEQEVKELLQRIEELVTENESLK